MAEKELKELWSKINHKKIQSCFANHRIIWFFIPPLAAHFGGVHEAMIKSAKIALRAKLQSADITDEELQSVFIGAEALFNSRPLIHKSADPTDDVPLTPNHFLVGQLGGAHAPDVIDITHTQTHKIYFCPKPYKTITKKYNARKKKGKEAPNNPKVY